MYEDIQEALKSAYNAIDAVYQTIKHSPTLSTITLIALSINIISLPIKAMKRALYIDNCRMHREPPEKSWKY